MNQRIDHLVKRYRTANRKWTASVFRSEYNEPAETPAQVSAYKWAEAWRAITHLYENELLKLREVRQGLVEGAVSVDESPYDFGD